MHKLYPHERFFILALLITTISGGAWFYEPLQEYLTDLLASAAGIISNTPKSPASAQSSLVGHWTFDGQDMNWATGVVSDKAGTNNGQIVGMSTSTAPVVGVHGQGLAFDGSDDNIKLDANISNFSGLARGTVSMWFNIIDPKLQYPFLTLGDNNPTADAFWQIGNDSTTPNRIRFIVRNGGVMVLDGTATQNIVPNRWYHVAVTNDTNGNALYINGAAEPVSYSAGNAQTDAFFDNVTGVDGVDTMRIGTRLYGGTAEPGTPLTNGSLDDVRIYNRALTADEITALYRAGSSAKLSTTPKSPASAQSSLVGHWTFDGQDVNWRTGVVSDKAGTNNGQMQGTMSTSTSPVAGVHGQGLKFDGVDDYVETNEDSEYDFSSQQFSVSGWFRWDQTATRQVIIGKYGPSSPGDTQWAIEVDGGLGDSKLNTFFTNCTASAVLWKKTNTSINDKNWHHFTVVYDTRTTSESLDLYLDGALSSATEVDQSGARDYCTTGSGTVQIGKRAIVASPLYFLGSLDDVRIYNRALTADEITALYRAGSSAKLSVTPKSPASAQSSLVGHWTFDGPDVNWRTQTVFDRAGANNGTTVNLSTSTTPVAGVHGQAFDFTGDGGGYIDAGTNVLELGTFSVSAWVRNGNDRIAAWEPVFTNSDTQAYYGWQLRINSLQTVFAMIGNTGGIIDSVTFNTNMKDWRHVVVVRNGTTDMTLYVDGVLSDTDAALSAIDYAGTNVLQIGRRGQTVNVKGYTGDVDDIRVYNRAITPEEITALYRAGR